MFNLLRTRTYLETLDRSARREHRYPTAASVTLQCDAVGAIDVVLTDLSAHGARLRAPQTMFLSTPVALEIQGMPSLDARVIWSHGNELGLCFDQPLHSAVLDHLLIQTGERRS